jgi:hypothetical protein
MGLEQDYHCQHIDEIRVMINEGGHIGNFEGYMIRRHPKKADGRLW